MTKIKVNKNVQGTSVLKVLKPKEFDAWIDYWESLTKIKI